MHNKNCDVKKQIKMNVWLVLMIFKMCNVMFSQAEAGTEIEAENSRLIIIIWQQTAFIRQSYYNPMIIILCFFRKKLIHIINIVSGGVILSFQTEMFGV